MNGMLILLCAVSEPSAFPALALTYNTGYTGDQH